MTKTYKIYLYYCSIDNTYWLTDYISKMNISSLVETKEINLVDNQVLIK